MAAALLTAVLLAVPAARADSVRVNDDEPGQEAYFLAIKSVKFNNNRSALTMRAVHPGLTKDYVDVFEVKMYADRSKKPLNRRTYLLRWQREGDAYARKGLHLYESQPGMDSPKLLRCRGIAMKKTDADGDTAGFVTARVPHRCAPGTGSVRFNYEVIDTGGGVVDNAPGGNDYGVKFTRWVNRG